MLLYCKKCSFQPNVASFSVRGNLVGRKQQDMMQMTAIIPKSKLDHHSLVFFQTRLSVDAYYDRLVGECPDFLFTVIAVQLVPDVKRQVSIVI